MNISTKAESCILKKTIRWKEYRDYVFLLFSDRQSCTDVSLDSWFVMIEFKFEIDSLFSLCQTAYIICAQIMQSILQKNYKSSYDPQLDKLKHLDVHVFK